LRRYDNGGSTVVDVLFNCVEGLYANFTILQMTNTYYFRVDTDLACVDYHRHLQSAPESAPSWRYFYILDISIYNTGGDRSLFRCRDRLQRGCKEGEGAADAAQLRLLDERAELHVLGGESLELGDQQPTGRGFPTENGNGNIRAN